MTSLQHLIAWLIYLAGATGAMIALNYALSGVPLKAKRLICYCTATLLYLPWWTTPEQNWLTPALFTALYDGLGKGITSIYRSGFILLIGLAAAVAMALIWPDQKQQASRKTTPRPDRVKKIKEEPTY